MQARVVRALAMVVFFVVGIPGMIVASINDNSGAAVTFGLIAAAVALALIVASAVASPVPPGAGGGNGADVDIEARAEALEAKVQEIVRAGADERAVRDLVRASMQVARRSSPTTLGDTGHTVR